MTRKAKAPVTQEFLEAEMAEKVREMLCTKLQEMGVSPDVIAASRVCIEKPTDDAEIEDGLIAAADRIPSDMDDDEATEMTIQQAVSAIYRGNFELALWFDQFVATRDAEDLREMFASYGVHLDATLEKARQVCRSAAN